MGEQMDLYSSPLPGLVAAADDAYRLVRSEIIDTLPPRARIDESALTTRQRRTLDALNEAESNLASYRQDRYAAAAG
jgi:hypothetical protein